jgi:GT2 family glycosyltransferase
MSWLLETLPDPLRTALVHGSEGAGHLAACARIAAAAGFVRLAGELTLAAWVESPLDADLASQAAMLEHAPVVARELAAHVAQNAIPPADLSYYRRLAERRETAKIRNYLRLQSEKEPGNLFWERLNLTHALDIEDWDWAGSVLAGLPEPLARLLGGDVAMLRGQFEAALANYSRCIRLWECPGLEARIGLAHCSAGDFTRAGQWLKAGLAREPWRVQTLLVLNDLLWGQRLLRKMLPGRVEVLLYTYNKALDIDQTLESVFASDLYGARVTVLDNGSTDSTQDVLAAWRGKLDPGSLEVVSLPVNVGAPAARNWLMSLEHVLSGDWVVFLDDDVALPKDWLAALGASAALYPDAGVWGARVRDFSRPSHIQSADVFLEPLPGDGQQLRRFSLSSCHHQTLDRGQFTYVRPCATVTGCCHLFRAESLASSGGFDLRYSPSQYDDLDHDIRLLLAGRTPVYQGNLAVSHFKSTGSQGAQGQTQYGVGWANQYKLHHKYEPDDFTQAARTADQAAWDDALAKWRANMGA